MNMKSQKPEIVYSEPVREIMGKPPRKILTWGNTMILSILVLFLLFSWLIKYPDTIASPVIITTSNPPVTLVSKITGHIKSFFVNEKEQVKTGQIIAIMESTASLEEIKLLEQTIDTIRRPELIAYKSLPLFSQLGELQGNYGTFLKDLSDYNNNLKNDFYGSKVASLSAEIERLTDYINRLNVKEKLYSENQKIELKKFRRDSTLFSAGVIPEIEYETSRQSLLKVRIDLQQVRLDYSAKSIEKAEKHQELQENSITRVDEREKLISILREAFLNLKAQINIWKNNYLLISPVDGIASFTKFWTANQSVTKDESVVSIIPLEPGKFIGRVDLKMLRSGKVKTGQMVNIKLSSFPYLEYGMVRGIVKSKSMVPSGDAYVIEIELPQGLSTLYGIKLEFNQNMQGSAEIITEDIRLLQKIVNPFRYMITRNKKQ